MTDTKRLVLQGRATIVLLILILLVLVFQGDTEMDNETVAQLVAAGTAIVYALRSVIRKVETDE